MQSEQTRSKCKSTFTHNKILSCIRDLDTDLANRYSSLYQSTIDRGAHPNVEAMKLTESENVVSATETQINIAALSDSTILINRTFDDVIKSGLLVRDMIMRRFQRANQVKGPAAPKHLSAGIERVGRITGGLQAPVESSPARSSVNSSCGRATPRRA